MEMTDATALAELIEDNTRRIDNLCKRGVNPIEVSAVIRQINEDTVFAHILAALGEIIGAVVPEREGTDLLLDARLTAAGKLSRWLDEAEKQVERSKLTIAKNGSVPCG